MYKKEDKNACRLRRHMRQKGKIVGSASCPRISIYRSNKAIYAQLIDDNKHITICESNSLKLGLTTSTIESAIKVGTDLGEKAKALNIEAAVFDRSGYVFHGKVKALADAVRAQGIKF
jgi:large subunit ribosomal protein L18